MFIANKISQGINFGYKSTVKVLGSAGVIWALGDAMKLRNDENRMYWEITYVAMGVIGLIGFIRKQVNLHCRVTQEHPNEEHPNKELSIQIN